MTTAGAALTGCTQASWRKSTLRQCLTQVISSDMNLAVGELLQQLLFWQERAKAMTPLKAQKRLLSGLRCV